MRKEWLIYFQNQRTLIHKTKLLEIVVIMLLAQANLLLAKDISVSASVDRNSIHLDDVITFSIKIEGTRDFPAVPSPQSDGFVIISGPSQSSNIQIINGEMSASKTIQWRLAPTKTGKQEIKPISIKYRRKNYQTKAVSVMVMDPKTTTPAPQTGNIPTPRTQASRRTESSQYNIFLKADVSKTTLYKGEELIVSFDLYFQNVRNFATQKLPDARGFWTEQFPEKRNPTIESVVLNGIAYKRSTLRRLALFPTTTGDLVIDPMVINCEIVVPSQRRRSVFDDFFDDPFFRDPFFSSTKTVEVSSEPVSVHVKDLPVAGKPAGFSGAVGNFVIESVIDTLQTKQDQALTLRYKISGSGNINAVKLPPLKLPANVEIFEPKIERTINNKGKSIRGSVSYEYVLITRSSGRLRIPSLNYVYFDPIVKRYQSSNATGFNIDVKPLDQGLAAHNAGFSKEEVFLLGSDIRFIIRDNPNWQRLGSTVFTRFWFWFINILSLLVITGSILFRWWVDKLETNSLFARKRRALSGALTILKDVEKDIAVHELDDVCNKLDRGLTGFVSDRSGMPSSGIGPKEIHRALIDNNVDIVLTESVDNLLKELEQYRFLPGELSDKDYRRLLDTANEIIGRLSKVI
ncbi:MAG: protein BatD [Candidatus Marinimicrobia bacterium]|nr:protein BatD [Candidatus Neomarinimicrobiota bacterium]